MSKYHIPNQLEVESHKAAMTRLELSKPIKLAIDAEIITQETTIFDYGCGVGGDVKRLQSAGYNCQGWDPYYFPQSEIVQADVVNLGYIINVIADIEERSQTLLKAWEITQQVLIVSAQVLVNNKKEGLGYADGILTKRNTFQKYYSQQELREYIETTLSIEVIPIALGIFVVFRDAMRAENFRLSQFHSKVSSPKITLKSKNFADYEPLLQPLIKFVTDRGRIPLKGELINEEQIIQEFKTIKRAFQLVITVTSEEEWDKIAYQRSLDIQVYLALANFGQRRSIRNIPPEIRADIKAFFGSYEEACIVADEMLFNLGKPGVIPKLCQTSKVGKKLPKALYVHRFALKYLDPQLRLYEGCASHNVGWTDHATIVKFHTDQPLISYLDYPDFDTVEHPAIASSMIIDLRDLDVKWIDYQNDHNPPILHRKETFVTKDYPLYHTFAQLTKEEKQAGLYENTQNIGRLLDWEKKLQKYGVIIQNHHLVWNNHISTNNFYLYLLFIQIYYYLVYWEVYLFHFGK